MSSLQEQKILLLDCQTTGTSAARDCVLELGWAPFSALNAAAPEVDSLLLKQPEPLPKIVAGITGITPADLENALTPQAAWEKLHQAFATFQAEAGKGNGIAVAHYAQFERPFLEKFYQHQAPGQALPFPILCTYKIAQRLFPDPRHLGSQGQD